MSDDRMQELGGRGECPQCGASFPPGVYYCDTCEATGPAEEDQGPFCVAIYLVDRSYGGPEEGGWWYTHGTRIDHPLEGINPNDLLTVFAKDSYLDTVRKSDRELAESYRDALQLQLDTYLNAHRRSDIGSVISEGRYDAEVHEGETPPTHWPAERPHYE